MSLDTVKSRSISKSPAESKRDAPITTKGDAALYASHKLYETSSRLANANAILSNVVRVLRDSSSRMSQQKRMATMIQRSLLPLNTTAALWLHTISWC